ncbi:MAG TPA: hypothetical protein DEO70_13260 [Bacteroidales bacterium]|nr:MAG: hypothetical protein A2X11_06010 [Bacteroidetes bacterium GWE2_42_24]OFY31335.1 MAG: hypothetical protein A2X09_01090 [Bacteroidetes bacterium GWF2_43_11]PKP24438.1 MAG: hypothetical protein CVU06_04920 [Bacteroidetes bacterium HGW-Bacteroidetes-22]HBZ67796.1 hypothetical protein [Bacteroidales bacterium]
MSIHSVNELLFVFQKRCCEADKTENQTSNVKKNSEQEFDRKQTEGLRKIINLGVRSGNR